MKRLLALFSCFALASCALHRGPKFDPRTETASTAVEPAFNDSSASQSTPAELLQPPPDNYKLGPGDKLDIEILGETGSRADTFVTPDSKVYYNLLAGVDVGGVTTNDLKATLQEQLAKFYKNPQVSVTLLEAVSQRVWVLGRVNNPGIYPLKRQLRVLDAISLAGGLFASRFTGTTEELADLQHSFISRNGEVLPVDFQKLIRSGDLSQNIYLQANDFIYLPSALTNEVYVLGAVTEPRPVGFMNEMNLIAVLGRGLGLQPNADLTHVNIIRGSLTSPRIATINAKDVIQGKATNIRLEPGDIVFVPGPGQMSLESSGKEAVNTFVRVIAATEGGHAATASPQNIGVNVNIGGAN